MPVRLNLNQFLSNGYRKAPNRVYAQLIQSACGWGKDDCAIMSFLILFHQAGRQAGRWVALLCGVHLGRMPTATRHGWMSSAPNTVAVKGFHRRNTGLKPGLERQGQKEMR